MGSPQGKYIFFLGLKSVDSREIMPTLSRGKQDSLGLSLFLISQLTFLPAANQNRIVILMKSFQLKQNLKNI